LFRYVNMNDPGEQDISFRQSHLTLLLEYLKKGTVWCADASDSALCARALSCRASPANLTHAWCPKHTHYTPKSCWRSERRGGTNLARWQVPEHR
jgi:hypothetical protein